MSRWRRSAPCAGKTRSSVIVPVKSKWSMPPGASKCRTATPTDPDLIGPFDTYEDAKAFTEAHPERCREADFRCMATPAFEVLCEHEINADRARFASELGVTSDVLKPRQAPRDVIVEVSPEVAGDVAQYLERNCPLPGVQEICALLKVVATTACVVYPRDTPPPSEPQLAE